MKTKAWQAKLKQISFRWHKLALVLFSLLALLFFANQSQSVENKSKAVVASCFDGDTVKLADRRVVRITGIDAPEVVHDNAPEPFYAQKARDELFALLGGKKVTLKTTSVTPRDRFGRLLADLILEDGQSIAELMVKRGAAYFFPHKELAPDFQERLLLLQREAITARVGLWELLLEDSVARESYVPRGTRVPIQVMKYYITTQDNQSNIKFEIYAGERKLIKDNLILDRIILKGLPQMNKGQVKIEVIFDVDENFILHVTAKELSNNITKTCDVVINECLTQNQILAMVEDAQRHEQEDTEERERIQAMLRLNDKIFEYSHLYEGNEDILRELESYRNWIKHSTTVLKEEYEKKLKELNDTMIKDRNEAKTRKQTVNSVKKTNNKIEEEKNSENNK